jgi:hypothetical protein
MRHDFVEIRAAVVGDDVEGTGVFEAEIDGERGAAVVDRAADACDGGAQFAEDAFDVAWCVIGELRRDVDLFAGELTRVWEGAWNRIASSFCGGHGFFPNASASDASARDSIRRVTQVNACRASHRRLRNATSAGNLWIVTITLSAACAQGLRLSKNASDPSARVDPRRRSLPAGRLRARLGRAVVP